PRHPPPGRSRPARRHVLHLRRALDLWSAGQAPAHGRPARRPSARDPARALRRAPPGSDRAPHPPAAAGREPGRHGRAARAHPAPMRGRLPRHRRHSHLDPAVRRGIPHDIEVSSLPREGNSAGGGDPAASPAERSPKNTWRPRSVTQAPPIQRTRQMAARSLFSLLRRSFGRFVPASAVIQEWEWYARDYARENSSAPVRLGVEWNRPDVVGVDASADALVQYLDRELIAPLLGTPEVVLEIGSGGGRFTEVLLARAKRVIAADASPTMLKLLKR